MVRFSFFTHALKLTVSVLIWSQCFCGTGATNCSEKKNVLLVIFDDLRPTDLPAYHNAFNNGTTIAKVPNLERFANTATVFRKAFVQVCGIDIMF